jgi:5-methylcytosine-specific restriction protein A
MGKYGTAAVRATTTVFARNPFVIAETLHCAKGKCEKCGENGPFISETTNTRYLEVHHVKRLADGGYDSVSNAVAICPNCHRELHHGSNKLQLLEELYRKISRLMRA